MISSTLARYLFVGVANTAVGYGVILILQLQLGMHPVVANALGYVVGMIMSYALNRRYTFRSQRGHTMGVPIFVVSAAICYLLNVAVLQFSINVVGLPAAISQALAICAYTFLFYIANRYVVFSKHGA